MPSSPRPSFALAFACAFVFIPACDQAPPPSGEGTGGDFETPQDDELSSHYPLVDGATWTYVQKNLAGQVTGNEEVVARAGNYDGREVFIFTDNPDAQGEWTESYILREGTNAVRVHKELFNGEGIYSAIDYDPGFTRADDAWLEVSASEERSYTRTETDGAGGPPVVEPRSHAFSVDAIDVEVTVPAGTFRCIEVTRIRTDSGNEGEEVHFWYAAGVGKVREERPLDDKVEELAAFDIPGGKSSP